MVKRLFILIMLTWLSILPSFATDVGVFGHVFPIQEEDFLTFIHQRLENMKQTGQLQQAQQDFIRRVKAHTIRPVPVAGITTTDHPETRDFNPSFTLTRNITDGSGHVLYQKGMRINPLNPLLAGKYHVPIFNETLIFIDGNDQKEITWLNHNIGRYHQVKIILVKGNIRQATKALHSRVYFDQHGMLCHHFGITHVPSIITRDHNRLKIREIGQAALIGGHNV